MKSGLESAGWWVTSDDLVDVAAYVKRRGYKRVALQFPDELLAASPDIAAALTTACNKPSGLVGVPRNPPLIGAKPQSDQAPTLPTNESTPFKASPFNPRTNQPRNPPSNHEPNSRTPTASTSAPNPESDPNANPDKKPPQQGPAPAAQSHSQKHSETEGPVRVFVLADTTYGSCCIDEVAAAHADAQCVVHFGRACLSPTSRLPARFVFGAAPLDVADCGERLSRLAETTEKPLLILFGLDYAHAIPQLQASFQVSARAGIHFADLPPLEIEPASARPCKAGDGTVPASQTTEVEARTGNHGASESSRNEITDAARLDQPSTETRREEPPVASTLSTPLKNESDAKGDAGEARAAFSNSAESSGAGEEFRSGGLTWHLPRGKTMADFVVVWVGAEGAALTDVMLTHNRCQVAQYNPEGKRLVTDVTDSSRFLRRRYYLVERAKNADIVGIVVGTLSSAGYRHVIKRLRDVISAAGKKSYTFVMGKPNPAKLANFPECGVFVLVACPQTALLDSKEYLSPVITPFEAKLAFARNSVWTGEYRLDFGDMAREERLGKGLGGGSAAGESDRDEEDEPRFSLISGAYEPGAARGITPGKAHGSTAVALVGNGVKALQVAEAPGALTLAGQRRQQSGAKSGAEYLVSKRTYQGLSVPQQLRSDDGVNTGVAEESTAVVLAVKGRSGRAAGYIDER